MRSVYKASTIKRIPKCLRYCVAGYIREAESESNHNVFSSMVQCIIIYTTHKIRDSYSKIFAKLIIGNRLFNNMVSFKVLCDKSLYQFGFKQIIVDLICEEDGISSKYGIIEINDHYTADSQKQIGIIKDNVMQHICCSNKSNRRRCIFK